MGEEMSGDGDNKVVWLNATVCVVVDAGPGPREQQSAVELRNFGATRRGAADCWPCL